MKVFAVTEHSCAGMEDDTDVLVGIFFKKEDATKAMNERFNAWSVGYDYNETHPTYGLDGEKCGEEKVWSEIDISDDFITVTNMYDGWSSDHIVLTVEEVEVK